MMKLPRSLPSSALLAGALFLVLVVAACGGDSDDGDAENTATRETATPTATPTEEPTPSPTTEPTATPTPYVGDVARIRIPRFSVDSDIEAVGVTNNQMDTPADPHNTAFYDPDITGWGGNERLPGWRGNAVFSAHVNYWPDVTGPFARLTELEDGDQVVIQMDNGEEYTYEVFFEKQYEADAFPTGEIIDAPDRPEDEEWITLITCGGTFVETSSSGFGEYLHRDVVIARRVS